MAKWLTILNNNIEDNGLKYLIKGLKENADLTNLDLSGLKVTLFVASCFLCHKENTIVFETSPELIQILSENYTIKELNLNIIEKDRVKLNLAHHCRQPNKRCWW